MSSLRDRIALVTGGSGGIGQCLALRLAGAGAPVAVHYSTSAGAARDVVERITAGGGQAVAVHADLASPQAPDELIGAVEESLGPVDVLVANHGHARRRAAIGEVSAGEWDATLAVNARAPFLLARRVLPGMQERGFGRVLFVSSVAALTGGVVGPDYAASKAALHGSPTTSLPGSPRPASRSMLSPRR